MTHDIIRNNDDTGMEVEASWVTINKRFCINIAGQVPHFLNLMVLSDAQTSEPFSFVRPTYRKMDYG